MQYYLDLFTEAKRYWSQSSTPTREETVHPVELYGLQVVVIGWFVGMCIAAAVLAIDFFSNVQNRRPRRIECLRTTDPVISLIDNTDSISIQRRFRRRSYRRRAFWSPRHHADPATIVAGTPNESPTRQQSPSQVITHSFFENPLQEASS